MCHPIDVLFSDLLNSNLKLVLTRCDDLLPLHHKAKLELIKAENEKLCNLKNKAIKQSFVNKRVLRSNKSHSKMDVGLSSDKSNCVLSVDDHCDNNIQSSGVKNHYDSSNETYGNNIKCPDIKNSRTRLAKKSGTGLKKSKKAIPVSKARHLNNKKKIDKPISSYNLRNKKK